VTKTGREEFESLARFASMGRIKVEYMGRVEDVPSNISSTQRDEMIVDLALKYNAILFTADNSMKLCGLVKGVSRFSFSTLKRSLRFCFGLLLSCI
jgi:predicted PilT family ATPase